MALLTNDDIGMIRRASEQLLPQTRTSDTVSPPSANPDKCTRAVQMSPYFVVRNANISIVLPVRPIGTKTRLVKNFKQYVND
jgi:hypothetical protein